MTKRLALVLVSLVCLSIPLTAHAEPAPTTVTATLEDEVRAGDVVEISGAVMAGEEDPLEDAEVVLSLGGRRVEDASSFTDEEGAFTTQVEIPEDTPSGEVELELTFEGNEDYAASTMTLPLTVEGTTEPTPEETPTPTATPTPTEEPTPEPENQAPETDGAFRWAMVAVVAVAALATLITGVVAVRAFNRRSDGDGDLNLLADPRTDGVEDPVYPEEGTVLSDDVSEPTDNLSILPAADEPLPTRPTASREPAPRPPAPQRPPGAAPAAQRPPRPAPRLDPTTPEENKPLFREERDAPPPRPRRGMPE